MRVVIQRVKKASLSINDNLYSKIGQGLMILLGIEEADNDDDINWLCEKITKLRIFDDENGVMNLNVMQISGEIMLVSQFTLMASTKKGNRPSYIHAAKPEISKPLYEKACKILSCAFGKQIKLGVFGENMQIELVNDGPVTIFIDSKNRE